MTAAGRQRATALAASLGAAAGGLLVMLGVVAAFGYDARDVARAFGVAVAGSWDRFAAVLLVACPLIVIGLALTLAFRCGVWNIGAEGQYLLGALGAAVAARLLARGPGVLVLSAVLAAGLAGGAVWAGVAAVLKRYRGVQEVLSTILLNFVAIQIAAIIVRGWLVDAHSADRDTTAEISAAATLSILYAPAGLHAGIVIAIGLAPLLWVFLERTTWGFRTRAVGLNPIAAGLARIPVGRFGVGTFVMSGALAGLAGAIELSGNTHYLTASYASGYGYTAIAVALLARLEPLGVIPAAIFFAALETGVRGLQKSPDPALAGFPTVLTQVAQGVVILATVMLTRTRLGGAGRAR